MGKITKNFLYPPEGTDSVIYHCRAASVGKVELKNQHPFAFYKENGTRIVGIHNGTLSNNNELNQKREVNFSVDSKHIYHTMANDLDFTDLRGSAALAWYEIKPDGSRSLRTGVMNSSNLAVAKLKTGELVFASTREAVELAVGLNPLVDIDYFYAIESNCWYSMREELYIYKKDKKFGTPKYSYNNSSYQNWDNYNYSIRQDHRRSEYTAADAYNERRNYQETRLKIIMGVDKSKAECYNCRQESVEDDTLLCDECLELIESNFEVEMTHSLASNERLGAWRTNYGYEIFDTFLPCLNPNLKRLD